MGHRSSDHWTCGPSAKMSEQSSHVGPGRLFAVRVTDSVSSSPVNLATEVNTSLSTSAISACPTISNLSTATARGSMTSEHHVSQQHQDGILWHNAHIHSLKKEVNAHILDLLDKTWVIKANSPCAVRVVRRVQNRWNIQALHAPFPQLQNNPLQTPLPMIQRPVKHTGGILVLYHGPEEITSPGVHPRGIQTPDSVYHSLYKWIYLPFGLSSGPAMFQRWMEDPLNAGSLIWRMYCVMQNPSRKMWMDKDWTRWLTNDRPSNHSSASVNYSREKCDMLGDFFGWGLIQKILQLSKN